MILTATPDRWDYRRAFRSSLSVTAEGQGRWSASTQLMDLRFEIELEQICEVAVLRVSCQCREHYTFVPPMLPPEAMREVIEERLVDEILWAYDKKPWLKADFRRISPNHVIRRRRPTSGRPEAAMTP